MFIICDVVLANVDKILRENIEKRTKEMDAKIKAKDYTGLSALYNDKCKLMPPSGETIVGKAGTKKVMN